MTVGPGKTCLLCGAKTSPRDDVLVMLVAPDLPKVRLTPVVPCSKNVSETTNQPFHRALTILPNARNFLLDW
jgi:hypothetical protein